MEKQIWVGKSELLEWLDGWGDVGEGDKIKEVRIGYGPDIEFVISSEEED